jgi:hypothetical protein
MSLSLSVFIEKDTAFERTEVEDILKEFDRDTDTYVEQILKPSFNNVYIFFTTNVLKFNDFKVNLFF